MAGWNCPDADLMIWQGTLRDNHGGTIPKGAIIIWAQAAIPSGWQICDGTNGTVDLRAFFVRGITGAEVPGDSGGTDTHTHTMSGFTAATTHSHGVGTLVTGTPSSTCTTSTGMQSVASSAHTHTITGSTATESSHVHAAGTLATGSSDNIPAYKAVYFIQKM